MWAPFSFFLGAWQGNGQGQRAASRIQRTYELILSDKFVCQPRSAVTVKGKGEMEVRIVLSKKHEGQKIDTFA